MWTYFYCTTKELDKQAVMCYNNEVLSTIKEIIMVFITKIKWENELENLISLGKEGKNMVDIGRIYGVSRQRIKQIIDQYIPEWLDQYGMVVRKKEKQSSYYAKWGVREDSEFYDSKRRKYRNKKANALSKGIEWDLPFGSITWPEMCPILGITLDYFNESRVDTSPSFDRIDPTKGYVVGNVQVISFRANRIKNDGTQEELEKIAAYLRSLDTTR